MSAIASVLRNSPRLLMLPVIANEVTRSFSTNPKYLLCQRLLQFFELRNDFSYYQSSQTKWRDLFLLRRNIHNDFSLISHYERSEIIFFLESTTFSSTRKPAEIGLRVTKCIEKTDLKYQYHLWCFVWIALSFTAMRIEKINIGFLDTNLSSFGSTRKPFYLGLRVTKFIEKTDNDFLRNALLKNLEI
jgi:hypothetical protein